MSGVLQVIAVAQFPLYINLQLQISEETKPWLVWDQKFSMKTKTEKRYFATCVTAKLLQKEK